ncbi:MAG: D-glycerate dehydrogenase [Chloroflexi bacterium]|nr:D-glycerate dehydrogenase [Chloroflexota bacterium]MCY4248575.1 D-glycerate dehydrogenase [Chloroflexota bacterium]
MSQHKVFVTRELPAPALDRLARHCELDVWDDFLPPDYAILLQKAQSLSGLLCLLTDRIDARLLAAAPHLKVVSNMAVGYDNIDVAAASARGIPVGNTPGVLTETTADFAFALLMATARRIPEAQRYIHAGRWQTWHPTVLSGRDIHGACLGIIGFGRIGQAVARRAAGFGMRILTHSRSDREHSRAAGAEPCELDDLLEQSDFVSLHLPLTHETRQFIGARELALMKPTAILINTARGGVVDQTALYEALRDKAILAAGLDVTDPEPIPLSSPLLTLENCLVLPHIASASVATRAKMAQMAVDNCLAGLRGERLPTCVNAEVYSKR